MALIKCKECGNEISSKADSCPKCGFPLKQEKDFDPVFNVEKPKKKGRFGCLFTFLIIFALSVIGVNLVPEPKTIQSKKTAKQPSVIKRKSSVKPPVAYEIVDTQDQSHKALVKSLSAYKLHELKALPLDKKMLYMIVVSPKIKENQVRPTIEKIISDITTRDNDIDEISLFLFSDKEVAKGGRGYDVASATWAPSGKLGNITPDIAKNNIRTGYKISIEAKENLEAYLKQRGLSEEKFGFTEKQRRQIFIEIVTAEVRADAEAEKIYPLDSLNPNYKESNVSKYIDRSDVLMKKYRAKVRSKHGITKEIQLKISVEGLQERWPMP